jgi:hypothetical protein
MPSSYRMEYHPPDGSDPLVFDPRAVDGPFMLLSTPDGIMPSSSRAVTRRSPGQRGESLAGVLVESRVAVVQVAILAGDDEEYWAHRENLTRKLVIEPPMPGENPQEGKLRVYRPNNPTLELPCIPENSPQEVDKFGDRTHVVDIEFKGSSPYWRTIEDDVQEFLAGGGFTFPLEHPFEIVGFDVRAEPVNVGNVYSPVQVIIRGEAVNPRLTNVTTGKTMRFVIPLAAGAELEIDTSFGRKRVIHRLANGTEENGMKYLDLTESELWWIRPGTNHITFEADDNVSGSARISWRSMRSGF